MFDPSLKEFAPAIGRLWGIGAGEFAAAGKFKEAASTIHKHSQLEELILLYHGFPGGISFTDKSFSLSDLEL